MMKQIICTQCGCTFNTKRIRKFCSHACSNKARASYTDLTKSEYDQLYRSRSDYKQKRKSSITLRHSKLGDSYKLAMLKRAEVRAFKKHLDFNIDISDINIPIYCPMLGIKLEFAPDKKGGDYNSPSLDRIKPELGYVKGNVMVISKRANMIKTDASLEEIEKVYLFLKMNGDFQDTQGLSVKELKQKYPMGLA